MRAALNPARILLPWVSARPVHRMQRHRKPNTWSVVYGTFPTTAKRTLRTKQLSWNTMSQSPYPRRAMDRRVTDVEIVQTTSEECLEGEHLKFKAHIRGWKTASREKRCQSLLAKTKRTLRKALLSTLWKDVLLVPQAWYPEYTPKRERVLFIGTQFSNLYTAVDTPV